MASLDNLTVTTSTSNPNALAAAGQIDSHTSPMLDEALTPLDATAEVEIDLAEVTFIDSSGLRILVRTHNRQRDNGGTLTIVAPSEAVCRLFDITGLTSELTIRR